MTVLRIEGTVQSYSWGSMTALADLLGREPSGVPEAELWLGDHPRGPAKLAVPQGPNRNLAELFRDAPELLAGAERLPFLFKVLAVNKPLSIQAHPSKSQAEAGFRREEEVGVARDARHRNYPDPTAKPEMVHALTPFRALCGFCYAEELFNRLKHFGLAREVGPLAELVRTYSSEGYGASQSGLLRRCFQQIFRLTKGERARALAALNSRLDEEGDGPPIAMALRFVREHCREDDIGLLCALLLNVVELQPGQAAYLPPGILHAYLDGLGLELMANSDNVLRAGLTEKHVDPAELEGILSFEPYQPSTAKTVEQRSELGAVVTHFLSPAEEFRLSTIHVSRGRSFRGRGPAILLVLSGEVTVWAGGSELRLARGGQAFCSALVPYELHGNSWVARASTGEKEL